MPLSIEAATAKDKRTGLAPMQHRHFSTIAAVLASMPDRPSAEVAAHHFASELIKTNPAFNRARFLTACEVES